VLVTYEWRIQFEGVVQCVGGVGYVPVNIPVYIYLYYYYLIDIPLLFGDGERGREQKWEIMRFGEKIQIFMRVGAYI